MLLMFIYSFIAALTIWWTSQFVAVVSFADEPDNQKPQEVPAIGPVNLER